jgi:hypothetical protein
VDFVPHTLDLILGIVSGNLAEVAGTPDTAELESVVMLLEIDNTIWFVNKQKSVINMKGNRKSMKLRRLPRASLARGSGQILTYLLLWMS